MGTILNSDAYRKLIDEDIKWLTEITEHSLEQSHIILILEEQKRKYDCFPDTSVEPPPFDIIKGSH